MQIGKLLRLKLLFRHSEGTACSVPYFFSFEPRTFILMVFSYENMADGTMRFLYAYFEKANPLPGCSQDADYGLTAPRPSVSRRRKRLP